jgi:hypothetical protein
VTPQTSSVALSLRPKGSAGAELIGFRQTPDGQ